MKSGHETPFRPKMLVHGKDAKSGEQPLLLLRTMAPLVAPLIIILDKTFSSLQSIARK